MVPSGAISMPVDKAASAHLEGLPVVRRYRINHHGAAMAIAGQIPSRRQVIADKIDIGGVGAVGNRQHPATGIAQIGRRRLDAKAHVSKIKRIGSRQSKHRARISQRIIELELARSTFKDDLPATRSVDLGRRTVLNRNRT